MLIEAIRKRLDDYDQIKKYYNENKNTCNTEMDVAVRTAVMSIVILLFLYIVLFFMTIFYAFKCANTLKWPIYVPILLLFLSFVPLYGGYFMIGIVIYGMINCGGLCN
jgi:hypothetical protein